MCVCVRVQYVCSFSLHLVFFLYVGLFVIFFSESQRNNYPSGNTLVFIAFFFFFFFLYSFFYFCILRLPWKTGKISTKIWRKNIRTQRGKKKQWKFPSRWRCCLTQRVVQLFIRSLKHQPISTDRIKLFLCNCRLYIRFYLCSIVYNSSENRIIKMFA